MNVHKSNASERVLDRGPFSTSIRVVCIYIPIHFEACYWLRWASARVSLDSTGHVHVLHVLR